MKRENRKIDKRKMTEITGNRPELEEFMGKDITVECFVTNTIGYRGGRRLVTEVKIGDLFIKHLWFKYDKIGKLPHGYQKLEVEITKYEDQVTHQVKYGMKYTGDKGKVHQNTNMKIPQWKLDQIDDEKLKKEMTRPKRASKRSSYKPLRVIKKGK